MKKHTGWRSSSGYHIPFLDGVDIENVKCNQCSHHGNRGYADICLLHGGVRVAYFGTCKHALRVAEVRR